MMTDSDIIYNLLYFSTFPLLANLMAQHFTQFNRESMNWQTHDGEVVSFDFLHEATPKPLDAVAAGLVAVKGFKIGLNNTQHAILTVSWTVSYKGSPVSMYARICSSEAFPKYTLHDSVNRTSCCSCLITTPV